MRVGNNFSRVCLSVCQSLFVCLCIVQAITFELMELGTSFSVHAYIFTKACSRVEVIGRSVALNVKVI